MHGSGSVHGPTAHACAPSARTAAAKAAKIAIAASTSLSTPHPQDAQRQIPDLPGWFRKRHRRRCRDMDWGATSTNSRPARAASCTGTVTAEAERLLALPPGCPAALQCLVGEPVRTLRGQLDQSVSGRARLEPKHVCSMDLHLWMFLFHSIVFARQSPMGLPRDLAVIGARHPCKAANSCSAQRSCRIMPVSLRKSGPSPATAGLRWARDRD